MKIKVFTYGYNPEKFLVNELTEYLAKNHSVTVSTSLPNYPKGVYPEGYSFSGPYTELLNGVLVKRFPVILRKKGIIYLVLNYITNLMFGILNISRLGKGDVSFVFATSPIMVAIPAIVYSKIMKIPVIIWLQDLWPESFNAVTGVKETSVFNHFLNLMVKWIYKNTDVMLIQSEGFKKNLEKYNFQGRVEWIPNWAPEAMAHSHEPEWVRQMPDDKFIVTFAGNIGIAQKLETLLEVAKLLEKSHPKIFFAIVGDGRESKRLQDEYGHLSNLNFYGRQPIEDMGALFKKSSALLVILKKEPAFSLTIPSKFQSYLTANRPLIMSLDGIGKDLVNKYQIGVCSEAEDVKQLMDGVIRLYGLSKDEIKLMGDRAYKLYESEFISKNIMKKIDDIMIELRKS